jgi:hypothetical protein
LVSCSFLISCLTSACTIVVAPDPPPPPPPVIVAPPPSPPPVKPLEAHLLFVVNLHTSAANLAAPYANLITEIVQGLSTLNVRAVRWAITATYPGADGPRLLLGAATTPDAEPTFPADLPGALRSLATSGRYDGASTVNESQGLLSLGHDLAGVRLPAEQGGLANADFFDRQRALFAVVYMQPLARRCAATEPACGLDGRAPTSLFAERDDLGGATWLRYQSGPMPAKNTVQVSIATSENESVDAFRTRCGALPGFPRTLFDVIEPSPLPYFTPLMQALNAAQPGTGQTFDFCKLIVDPEQKELFRLISSIAAVAAPPSL